MAKRYSQRAEDLRRALAQEAARIMAEHGIEDFLQAKRKAADRLGVNDVAVLPKNIEIEAALRAHQRLFGRDSHDHTLKEQRRIALGEIEGRGNWKMKPRPGRPCAANAPTPHVSSSPRRLTRAPPGA